MKECITHHYACDCREEKFEKLLEVAKWALAGYTLARRIGEEEMKECITHHHACDCREEKFEKLREAAKWAMDGITLALPPEFNRLALMDKLRNSIDEAGRCLASFRRSYGEN